MGAYSVVDIIQMEWSREKNRRTNSASLYRRPISYLCTEFIYVILLIIHRLNSIAYCIHHVERRSRLSKQCSPKLNSTQYFLRSASKFLFTVQIRTFYFLFCSSSANCNGSKTQKEKDIYGLIMIHSIIVVLGYVPYGTIVDTVVKKYEEC